MRRLFVFLVTILLFSKALSYQKILKNAQNLENFQFEGEDIFEKESTDHELISIDFLTKYNSTIIQATFLFLDTNFEGFSIDETSVPIFEVLEGTDGGRGTPLFFNVDPAIYFENPKSYPRTSQSSVCLPRFINPESFSSFAFKLQGKKNSKSNGLFYSVYIFTNFFNISSLQMSFSLFSHESEPSHLVVSMPIGEIVPMVYHRRLLLDSIELGRQFHYLFNSEFLKRNLSAYPGIQTNEQVFFMTMPRSGTHAFVRSLGDALGEFVQLNNYLNDGYNDQKNYDIKSGEWKGNNTNIRIMTNHIIPPEKVANRFLFSVREFLEALDSGFVNNARMSNRKMKCDWRKRYMTGYHHEILYEKTIKSKANLFKTQLAIFENSNLPVFVVRYEDLIKNPLETLCSVVSFVEGIECRKLKVYKELKRQVESEGLKSSYLSSNPENHQIQSRENAWDKVSSLLIEDIYSELEEWVHYFDYQNLYLTKGSEKIRKLAEKFEPKNLLGKKFHELSDFNMKKMLLHQIHWSVPYKGFEWDQKDYKKQNRMTNEHMKLNIFAKYVRCLEEK